MTWRRDASAIYDKIVARLKSQPSPLKQLCAWCGVTIQEGRTLSNGMVSHGICSDCAKKYFPERA